MKNTANTVRAITEIGIIAALGYVFDELQSILFKGIFINGGSIGIAMIAVLIIAYRRGVIAAVITGLIMGLIDVATSAYILHPIQMLLDYVFPYAFVGVVGFLKPFYDKAKDRNSKILWLVAGTVIGGLLKFLSHYLAGVIFWSDPSGFAWDLNDMNPFLYSFVYNIAFMGPCIVLTGALIVVIQITAPRILENKAILRDEESKESKAVPMTLNIASIAGGLFLFIFYLIKLVNSFETYQDGGAVGYDGDPDAMLITVVGLFLIVLGTLNLVRTIKGNFSMVKYMAGFTMISLTAFIYGLARLIRTYVKNKPHGPYWVWFAATLVATAFAATVFIYLFIKQRREKAEKND